MTKDETGWTVRNGRGRYEVRDDGRYEVDWKEQPGKLLGLKPMRGRVAKDAKALALPLTRVRNCPSAWLAPSPD